MPTAGVLGSKGAHVEALLVRGRSLVVPPLFCRQTTVRRILLEDLAKNRSYSLRATRAWHVLAPRPHPSLFVAAAYGNTGAAVAAPSASRMVVVRGVVGRRGSVCPGESCCCVRRKGKYWVFGYGVTFFGRGPLSAALSKGRRTRLGKKMKNQNRWMP